MVYPTLHYNVLPSVDRLLSKNCIIKRSINLLPNENAKYPINDSKHLMVQSNLDKLAANSHLCTLSIVCIVCSVQDVVKIVCLFCLSFQSSAPLVAIACNEACAWIHLCWLWCPVPEPTFWCDTWATADGIFRAGSAIGQRIRTVHSIIAIPTTLVILQLNFA